MAKSSYFGNSAKLLSIVSALLFAANGLSALGGLIGVTSLQNMGTSLSSLVLYVGLVICFIAFNGEGVGHKRYRDRKSKRITGALKLNLLFCFVMNFVKGGLEFAVMTIPGAGGIISRFIMSLISTVSSYGFLLFAVSFWYVFRDGDHKKLLPLEVLAVVFGLLYNGYKFLNYGVIKYNISIFGDLFTELFSNNSLMKILCLLQFGFDIIMFAQVSVYYGKLGDSEQVEIDDNIKELPTAQNIFKDEGFGIDTLEDDFMIPITTQTEE